MDTPPTKRARKSFEPAFKLKVIKEARKSLVVRRWIDKEKALENSSKSPKPSKSLGSGRKPLNLDLEDELFCYIISRRAQNWRVTRSGIKRQALDVAQIHFKDENFSASDGWITKFLRRYYGITPIKSTFLIIFYPLLKILEKLRKTKSLYMMNKSITQTYH